MWNTAAKCGLLLGIPQSANGGDDLIFLPGSEWTVPVYSCTTVNQALLRTVSFRFNGTDRLSGLAVVDIADKEYPSEDDMPLSGVENLDMTLADVNPLWGLVSPELAAAAGANVSTLRKDSLLLPRFPLVDIDGHLGENLPAVDFPLGALSKLYSEDLGPLPDYSGKSSLAISRRWANLSRSAETVVKIPNLIWTDLAANSVVGTRSLAGSHRVPVTVYARRIQYRLPYALPAFLVLAALAVTSLATLSAALLRRTTNLGKMKRYLNATAAGRIMTAVLLDDPEEDGGGGSSSLLPTAVSAKRDGQVLVGVGSGRVELVGEGYSGPAEGERLLYKPTAGGRQRAQTV
jgi:hypothetical protein